MSGERRPPSLCDPALLPSIVPRIQTIAQLLLQARDTPLGQDEQEDTHVHGAGADASMTEAQPTSLALGTIANDDDDDGAWTRMASTGISMRRIPTSILARLAQETAQLQSTFAAAHEAAQFPTYFQTKPSERRFVRQVLKKLRYVRDVLLTTTTASTA